MSQQSPSQITIFAAIIDEYACKKAHWVHLKCKLWLSWVCVH